MQWYLPGLRLTQFEGGGQYSLARPLKETLDLALNGVL
jgi:hypothetical protein